MQLKKTGYFRDTLYNTVAHTRKLNVQSLKTELAASLTLSKLSN
jgi:hypothetical protein